MDCQRWYCAVYGCLNSSVNKPELGYFILPKDNECRSKWLRLIAREDLAVKIRRYYGCCEEHFDPADIIVRKKRKELKENALPCRHLPGKKGEQSTAGNTSSSNSANVKKRKLEETDNVTPENEREIFFKLCDKFLPKELADEVKAEAKFE